MKKEFDNSMLENLIVQGYTHILCAGVVNSETEDYILIPLKPVDPRLAYEESDLRVESIKSHDIYDMASGDEFISFYIDLPKE